MAGTAYQNNLAQPREEEKKGYTSRDVYRIIAERSQYDKQGAQDLYNKFMVSQRDSSSQFYNPYSQPTNRAVSNLQAYGFDTSNLNDDWFNQNQGWVSQNLQYNGTTNTPSKPGKKATWEQNVAYELYQWNKSEATTKKAEQEWEALRDELSFWAQNPYRNYSDEEIMRKIDWSKYKTLASMNENKYMSPTELNRGIDFSEDAMYGVLWAARNPEYDGDMFGAIANSALGTGYQWKENPEITARLDASNPDTYAPYTVGSTMDDVCVYYNQPKFTKEWLLANKPDGSDETATKMWNRAWKAEEFTEAVEEEADKADEWLSRILATAKDPEAVLKVFDNKLKNDWKNLKKLDDSLELVDSLYDTTRAVRYDYKDYKRIIEEQCAINRAKDTDDQVIERAAGAEALSPADVPDAVQVASPAQQAANQAADARLQEIAALVDDDEEVIPMLQDTIDNGWSVTFDNVYNAWDSLRNFGTDVAMYNLFGENRQEVLDSHADRSLANLNGMYDYEVLDNNVKSWKNELAALETKVGGRQYANQVVEANKEMLVEVDGETYRIGLVRAPGADGNDTYYLDWADWIKNGGEGGVDGETFDMLAQNEAVGDLIRKNNLEAILIEEAKKQNLVATEEDQKDLERMRELELRIEDGEIALADDKDNYQRQQAEFEKAQHDRDQAIFWMKAIGMDTTDLEKEDAVVSYLADFADYEATVWAAYSPSAVYRDAIEAGQSVDEVLQYAEQGNQEVLHELEREEAVLKYLDESGLKVPANYRQNLERSIAKLKRDVRDFDYFKMSQNSDFDEIVRKGKEEEYQNRPQQWSVFRNPELDWSEEEYYAHMDDSYDEMSAFANYGLRGIVGAFINQMTDYEKDTYYYLMGQGKKDEAMDYIQSLTDMSYGVLHTRLTEDIRKRTADAINHPKSQDFKTEAEFEKWKADHPNEQYDVQQDENGYHVSWTEGDALSFIGVNLGAILTSPFAAMASLGYMGYRAIAGGELNPDNAFLAFNNFRSSTREESAKAISDFYGEGTAGQKVVQMFYDILSNRLDSMMNAATFGWIGGGIGNKMLAEFIGASPMGISAAMDAMSEVKRRGGTDAQALGVGCVTFLSEAGTEAISLDNIKEAFKLGKEINAKTVKDFLKKWLTQSGISEMLGETSNDIIGNLFDDLIMGELSNHKELVWSYRMKGYEKEDAEAMARMDEIKNLAYTALTSYLSPGADIATYAASRGAYYLSKTNKKEGISILDVLREEKDNRQKIREEAEKEFNKELDGFDMEELDAEMEYRQIRDTVEDLQQNGVENGEGALILPPAPRQSNQVEQETAEEEEPVKKPKYEESKPTHDAARDYSILQTVKNASQSAQSATVASVINVSRTKQSALTAMAAAMRIQSVIDENFSEQESYYTPKHLKQHKMTTLEFVENMLLGSEMENVDAGLVKQAIQNAALAENSDASILLQSDEFWAADYDEQASMLAATVPNDQRNQNVLDATARSLHDYRVSQAVKGLVQNGLLNAEENAKNAVNDAKTVVDTRQKALKKAKEELKAKTDTLKTINEQNNANPSTENEHLWDRALNEYKTANDNAVRAEQELKDARKALKDAEAVLKSTKRDSYKDLYQQAEEQIAQEDQQEAEQKRIQEEQAKIEEEKKQAAEQERLEKEELRKKLEAEAMETENFARLNAEEFVDQTFKGLSDEDRRYAISRAMRLQREMSGDFYSVQGRKIFANSFAKKFGLNVQYTNDTWYNARIDPKTGTMMVSKNATQGDIMYAVMIHELTHMAEQSETYSELANTVLQMKYGEGMTWDAILAKMNSGDHTSKLAQDILARKNLYDNRLHKNHSYEDILQEFVADGVGYIVSGDQAAVDRLVAEKPSLARRILESIKSFLKKIAGIQGETLTQAQNVVDMLQKALNESEKQNDVKHSLNVINDDYMEAAENGDMEAAQQYVDEYAKEKGYKLTVFHGTGEFFNTFKRGWEGIHLGNPEQAAQAADTRYRDRSETTDYRWGKIKESISQLDTEQRESLVKSAYLLLDYMSNTEGLYGFNGDISNDSEVQSYVESIVDRYAQEQSELDGFATNPEDINLRMNTFDRQVGRRVMRLYAKINNPFLINGDVNSWTPMNIADVVLKRADGIATKEVYGENVDITGTDVTLTPEQRSVLEEIAEETGVTDETWDALSDVLGELGFDGIQYLNTYEGDRNSYSYMALKQSDIKLADPVTRDDNGEIIPLNERFNEGNDDIRYSMSDNILAEDDDGNPLATELFGGTAVIDTDRFSLNSFTEDEQERVRQALLNKKDANGKRLFTKKQVDKYMGDAFGIAKLIATDKTRWDFKASDNQVFLKPNNDYYFTLDASTLCAKRLLYQGTFDYVQHALPDEVFTPEDLIDLVNIMNEMGYETPCGICYVESRRRWLDTYAQRFLDALPTNADEFIKKYFSKETAEKKSAIRERFTEEKPSIDDLTTSDGLERLRHENQDMYEAFVKDMNAKGTANPKVVQLRTEYRGDIGKLTANDIQKVKDIGGLRIQSFSDFETPHLLDMMQAVLDMSARGLTSQAYTKVPNFAWVFGDTGIKINLSLIGKGTGLDENGNLVFDNREGINFDEAMKLREKYNKNVGTILVGINDDHIIAAMGDPRIDFIIPFHKSGWSKEELRKMPTLNNYEDYTATQNERYIIGRNKDGSYETESFKVHKERTGETLENFQPVGKNGYWNFKKSGQWNAENYLKMCAEQHRVPKFSQFLVDNGDGSFSLPKGKDKRSTSIREGYWKTLTDFKMYENDGYGRTKEDGTKTKVRGSEQREVTPNINMEEAYRVMNDYKLGRQMPDKADGTKGAFLPMENNNSVPIAVPAAEQYIELIRQRRRYTKPAGPGPDTLEADLPVNPMASAFGASRAPAVLGNTESESTEATTAQQNAMAIDAETGETVRYSLPSDAPYLSAVNHGDMETAQRIVDERAEEAFADSRVRNEDGKLMRVYHGTSEQFTVFDMSKGRSTMDIQGSFFSPWELDASGYGENIGSYYLNITNPADEGTAYAALRMFQGQNEAGKKAREYLISQGYDGVINGVPGQIEELIAFYPEQIKLADPATYDDNGNVIPLSERFNTEKHDIRYSLPSDEMLDEQYRYYMENQQQMGETEEAFFREQPDRGMQQRQFGYQTIQTVEGVRQEVKDWLKNHSRYRPQTNEQQVDRAVDWVMGLRSEIDPDGFWGALNEFESGNFNPLTADGQARMYVVMSLAANKNDVNVQKRIADAINKQGTSIGRALQARKLYRLMSPAGRVAVLQKEVDNMNAQLVSQGKPGNITLDYWTEQLAAAAQTEEEFQKVQEQMWKELGAQLPVTMFDRLQAWRMVSMLGNPRTHIRNIVGNWAFRLPVFVKNKVGAGLESIFIKDGERTKALRIDRSLMDWINEDAQKMKNTLTGEGKYNDRAKAEKYKQPFGKSKLGKAAQKWADYSSSKLEQEDWWFLERHYKNALGNWMTANKVTGEQLENDEGLLDSARAYAIQEAQKATYRDANKFAEWLSKGDRIKGVRFLTTTVMPFKKTPLNIMKRGLEYSPLGFLKTIAVDSFRLAEYQKWASGKKTTKADWALSPAQYIDKFSAGLTGVGIAGLGALLTSLGCLKLGFKKKDPEDQFEQAEGKQEYSLNLELFGHDLSYTIDWLAPSSMPLFVGAAMMEAYQDNELDVGTLLEDLGTITEPIWNLSMVDGITSIFDTSDYDDTNKAMQIIMKVGMNYVNSFVPTALGQFSRAIDPTRRKSYVRSGDKPSTVLYEFEKLQNKTPFSVWNIPYRDHRGNIDRGNVVGRAIQNMVSPGYFNDRLPDASLEELHRLYTDNKTNDNVKESELKNLAPSDAPHYFSVKGQTIRLTAEQYDQLDYETKQIEFDLIDRLLADPYYADLDDAERISMINDIRTFASQQAKFNQFPEISRDDWVSRTVKNNIDPLDAIKNRSEKHVVSSQIDGWTSYLLNHIEDGDMEEQQRAIDSLMMLDPDTDIDKIVKDGFVKQYQKAYKDGDDDTMVVIRMMLDESGFIFDYDDWIKNTVKNEEKWMEDYQ